MYKKRKMTEKEFVPYELAVKLKALGFDEPCIATHGYLELYINTDDGHLKAPLYRQAFRWFREKYKLSGTTQYFTGGYYCYTINDMKDTKESNRLFTEFKTYEEAELTCLTKLIEIVEGQKD